LDGVKTMIWQIFALAFAGTILLNSAKALFGL